MMIIIVMPVIMITTTVMAIMLTPPSPLPPLQYTAAAGIARAHVCWGLAALSVLTTLASFLMPVHHIPVKDTRKSHTATITHHPHAPKPATPVIQSLWILLPGLPIDQRKY